jgi:hypothetical protein
MVNTCGGCDKNWTGTSRCHCSACHETFSGITTFDLHRQANSKRGKCKKPAYIGLVKNDKGVWSVPQEEEIIEDEVSDLH